MSSRATLAMPLLILLAAPSSAAGSFESILARGHSHNDYDHRVPLHEALDSGFNSVEADVWFRRGDIWLSHTGLPWDWKGTLRSVYLDPLQALIDRKGSVYGDEKPFYLWIDIKDGGEELRRELRKQIGAYRMFAEPASVKVILTGDEGSKRKLVEEPGAERFCRDSNEYHHNDPPSDSKWRWYALKWSDYISWDGIGIPLSRVRSRLLMLIRAIHAKGKQVRFYSVPESKSAWRLLVQADADQISTDRPTDYRKFARE
jgi:hypothetical protein